MKNLAKSGENINRFINAADKEARNRKAFERAMRDMAADPQVQTECKAIAREFAAAELDGLARISAAYSEVHVTPPLR